MANVTGSMRPLSGKYTPLHKLQNIGDDTHGKDNPNRREPTPAELAETFPDNKGRLDARRKEGPTASDLAETFPDNKGRPDERERPKGDATFFPLQEVGKGGKPISSECGQKGAAGAGTIASAKKPYTGIRCGP